LRRRVRADTSNFSDLAMSYHVDDRESLPPYGTLIRSSEPDPADVSKRSRPWRAATMPGPSRTQLDKEDANEDNGVFFLVNKNGFPIDDGTWGRMWDHVAKIHPDGQKMVKKVKSTKITDLPYVSIAYTVALSCHLLVELST
jgi:hypothetical protein